MIYGMLVYSKDSGEILRFVKSDIPITSEMTASLQESLFAEIKEPFFISPASRLMCKYFETHTDDIRR